MGDLAQAIVDLGRTSEQRRTARRSLREATAVVVEAMLQHLRVGDRVAIDEEKEDFGTPPLYQTPRLYRVERIGWPLVDMRRRDPDGLLFDGLGGDEDFFSHPKGATTLVCYEDTTHLYAPPTKGHHFQGAVLLDVRADYVDEGGKRHPVEGRDVWRIAPSHETMSPSVDLHLATDDDLLQFAMDAATVVQRMNRDFSSEAKRFGDAAAAIARLAPR